MNLKEKINEYPAKQMLINLYREHPETAFEDLHDPLISCITDTEQREKFDEWWDAATVEQVLDLLDKAGSVVIDLTDNEIKSIQNDYTDETLVVEDYIKEVFFRGWFDININSEKFLKMTKAVVAE